MSLENNNNSNGISTRKVFVDVFMQIATGVFIASGIVSAIALTQIRSSVFSLNEYQVTHLNTQRCAFAANILSRNYSGATDEFMQKFYDQNPGCRKYLGSFESPTCSSK